jgi:hypothetical protein
MPSQDDTPIVLRLTGAGLAAGDLIYVYDVSAGGTRAMTIAEFITGLDALDAGVLADS